ncbi:hypothetical protein ES705_48747 [subsurface metagenome]
MYTPGNIIYFTPFYFSDEFSPKRKYFIILEVETGNNNILASLPTRSDHVPSSIAKRHGCINKAEINFNCYYFKNDRIITKSVWGFPKETYAYGEQLQLLPIEDLKSKYKIENVDYKIMGKLEDCEFKAIIACMRDSRTVKRKYRRLLGAKI